MFLSVFCLFLILMDGTYGNGFGYCPKYRSRKNFKISEVLKGTFYGVAKTYKFLEAISDCVILSFEGLDQYSSGMDIRIIDTRTKHQFYYLGSLSYKPPEVSFKVLSKYGGKHQILDTDTENFVILWSCSSWGWFAYIDQIWILSKKTYLTRDMNKKLSAALKKLGLDPDRLVANGLRCSRYYSH